MGIYSRYSAAFLVLALISPQVFSAVRVPVIQNNEYIRQVLSKQTATTGAVTTPAGDVAFYGAEKVYAFSTGDSVRPTVREVTPWISGQTASTGSVSYPYGPGSAYPNDPNLSPASATKIKVKPQVVVPKSKIIGALKTGLKSSPAQLALSATVGVALAGVGWLIDEGSQSPTKGQLVKPVPGQTAPLTSYKWSGAGSGTSATGTSPLSVINSLAPQLCYADWRGCEVVNYVRTSPTIASATITRYHVNDPSNVQEWPVGAWTDSTCPTGYTVQTDGSCTSNESGFSPVGDADLQMLDPWISSQSAEWLSGLIKDVCNGSPNPGGCFAQMADRSKGMIQGPATLQGPITSKTTSTTNPDGSVSTRTETTSTKYNFQYSNNYFDVDTEKKTTTTQDGEVISETVENDNTPVEAAPDPSEQPQEPEPEYTFNDSPFPDVEPFYNQKYPDGLQGVWDQAKADIDNSNFLNFLRSFVPSFSGSCPSFGMSFAIGSIANFGTHEFQSLCYVFDFIKVILMVSAVFLARQLTFGG